MIKDIKYSGYSAVPSDYESNDGTLATSLNLICEDNQIKPIKQPVPISINLKNSQYSRNCVQTLHCLGR